MDDTDESDIGLGDGVTAGAQLGSSRPDEAEVVSEYVSACFPRERERDRPADVYAFSNGVGATAITSLRRSLLRRFVALVLFAP